MLIEFPRLISSGEEGFLCVGVQRCAGGPSLGQLQTGLCGHADHHRLHQHPTQVLQVPTHQDGRVGEPQNPDLAGGAEGQTATIRVYRAGC